MILLDTDHFSVFTDERDPRHELLNTRMEAAAERVACTIVSVEETSRSRLSPWSTMRCSSRPTCATFPRSPSCAAKTGCEPRIHVPAFAPGTGLR